MDFEQQVIDQVKSAIRDSIKEKLSGYGSPLQSIISDAVKLNDAKIRNIVYSSVSAVVDSEEFKKEMTTQFAHSVARKLTISFSEGLADRAMQAIKSDQVLRAKAISAVEQLISSSQNNTGK